jgi:hypothetical protein
MKRLFKSKRGTIMLYITFIIVAIILVLITAVFAPMGVLFNVQTMAAGDMILNQSQSMLSGIQDPTIASSINLTIANARAAGQNNIEINSALFQYGWVLIVGITALILFIYARRLVETNSGIV